MKKINQTISIVLSALLIELPLYASSNIQSDGTTNTTTDSARNGVTIVNIADPNSKGLSHNKYNYYNVNSDGVILNNSKMEETNTQLGGYIYGNTHLNSNARVILNEVTSTNRSSINGYTEVAGQRADVVVANPNGISVNGAGYINVGSSTLTTGVPNISNGEISSYSVQKGDITIGADGLDTSNLDATQIYTTYLELNGAIHAKKLDVKLGRNEIDAQTSTIISSTNSNQSGVLLDASSLGAMYTNSIHLVGTDNGLGVNLPPEVEASSGEILIDNDGNIVLQKVSASNDMDINARSGDIVVDDDIYSNTKINLTTQKNLIINQGQTSAKDTIDINADVLNNKGTILVGVENDGSLNNNGKLIIQTSSLSNEGSLSSTDSITINTANDIINSGEIIATNQSNIDSKSIVNSGLMHSNTQTINSTTTRNDGNISATHKLDLNTTLINTARGQIATNILTIDNNDTFSNHGQIIVDENLTMNVNNLDNSGTLYGKNNTITSNDINNTQTISAQNLTINNTNTITNTGVIVANSTSLISDRLINDTNGTIHNNTSQTIQTNTLINNANITSNNTSTIDTDTLVNTNGSIKSVNDLDLDVDTLTNNNGIIESSTISIDGENLSNLNNGSIKAQDITLTTTKLFNEGNISTNQTLEIYSNEINNSGNIHSNLDNTLVASTLNNEGDISPVSHLNIKTTTLKNTNANILSGDTLDINTTILTNANSLIDATTLLINSQELNNTNNSYIQGENVTLHTTSLNNEANILADNLLESNTTTLTNSGTMHSYGNQNLQTTTLSNSGYVSSDANLSITSENLTSSNGQISSDTLKIDANTLHNSDTDILANTLELNVSDSITNDGYIQATNRATIITNTFQNNSDKKIVADELMITSNTLTNNGTLEAATLMDLDINDIFTNNSKVITTNNAKLFISTNQLDNVDGSIESNNSLSIDTNTFIKTSTSKLTARDDLNLTINNEGLTNDFNLSSGNNLFVKINGEFITANDLLAVGKLSLDTSNNEITNNTNKTISTLGELHLNGSTLTNSGRISGGEGNSTIVMSSNIINNSRISSSNNIGIHGEDITNHGSIASANDLQITSTNLTNNQTIFSGNDMRLYTSTKLLNNENANIFAMNNLTLAKNSGNEKTNTIENNKGTIQTYNGDMDIWAINLNNEGTSSLDYDLIYYDLGNNQETTSLSSAQTLNLEYDTGWHKSKGTAQRNWNSNIAELLQAQAPNLYTQYSGSISYDDPLIMDAIETRAVNKTVTNAAYLSSGKNMSLHVDNVLNQDATISSTNNIHFDITNDYLNTSSSRTIDVTNYEYHLIPEYKDKRQRLDKYDKYVSKEAKYVGISSTVTVSADSVTQAGGAISGTIGGSAVNSGTNNPLIGRDTKDLDSKDENTDSSGSDQTLSLTSSSLKNSSTQINKKQISKEPIVITTPTGETVTLDYSALEQLDIKLPTSEFGLFTLAKDPQSEYLIEMNPEFTTKDRFLSSDYLLDRMGFNPDEHVKRLGDGFYEQTLKRDQIFAQTGQAFLDPTYASNQAQYENLMNNAITALDDLELTPGIALSSEQINALTQDMVWMEYKVVDGIRVLAPTVYIANLDNYKFQGGQIIAGDDISLKVADAVINSGNIASGGSMDIDADSITNSGGNIESDELMQLTATNDITNTSGTIEGDSVLVESKEGNIINQTHVSTQTLGNKDYNITRTTVGQTASIRSRNGDTILRAKHEIRNIGAKIKSDNGNVGLITEEGDITFKAIKIENATNIVDGSNFTKTQMINYETGGVETANGSIIMQGGNDINLEGTKLDAKDTISLKADNTINMSTVNDVIYTDRQRKTSSGSISKETTITRDMSYTENVNGVQANAQNIVLNTNKGDINLEGVDLQASSNLMAKSLSGDVNVVAASYKEAELHSKKTTKSHMGIKLKTKTDSSELENLNLHSSELKISKDDTIDTDIAQSIKDTIKDTLGDDGKTAHLNGMKEGMSFEGENVSVVASNIDSGDKDIHVDALDKFNLISQEEIRKSKEVHEEMNMNLFEVVKGMATAEGGSAYNLSEDENTQVSSLHKGSSLKGNNIIIDAGEVNVMGSSVEGEEDVAITTDIGGINILNAVDTINQSSSSKDINVEASSLSDMVEQMVEQSKNQEDGDGRIRVKLGEATYDAKKEQSTQTSVVSSLIQSKKGDVKLDSADDINIQGSNLAANEGAIELVALEGDIAIKEAQEILNSKKEETHGKAEVSISVTNEYAQIAFAIKALKEATDGLKAAKKSKKEYKKEIKKLNQKKQQLQIALEDKEIGINQDDIDELQDIIDDMKADEKIYDLAIAAAGVTVATKTTALISQTASAAANSGTFGFTGGITLDVEGSKNETTSSTTTSVASNLSSKNLKIKTGESGTTTLSGSNVDVSNDASIDTGTLNLHASQNTSTTQSEDSSINGSITMGMGGVSASMGVGKGKSYETSTTHNNTQVNIGNNFTLKTKDDANLKGVNVNVAGITQADIGGDLNVVSLRDIHKSSESSYSVGVSGAKGSGVGGANGSVSLNKSTEYTVVESSFISNEADINVANNTHLESGTIATGSYDENNNFVDNNKLNLTTNTLSVKHLANSSYKKGTSAGVGQSGSTSNASYSKELQATRSKSLSTITNGTLTIKDEENSKDTLSNVNRDLNTKDKEIFKANQSVSLKAEVDNRLLTKDGRKGIKKEAKEAGEHIAKVTKDMPVVGRTLTYQTKDGEKVLLQDKKFYKYNKEGKLEELPKGDYIVYKSGMLNDPKDSLEGYHELTKGNILEKHKNTIIVNNASHGFVGDAIESIVGYVGIPTGNAYQNKEFNEAANNLGNILNLIHSQSNIVEKNTNRIQTIQNSFSDSPIILNNFNTLSIGSPEFTGDNQGQGNTMKNALESTGQKYLGGVNNKGDGVSRLGFNKRENAPNTIKDEDGHSVKYYPPQLEKPEIKQQILEILPELKDRNGSN